MALKYGFVVGEFAEVVGDRGPIGDADRLPDQLGTAGTVTFTPASASIIDSDAETGQMVFITPRAVQSDLDTAGQLIDKDKLRGQWLVVGQYQVKASFLAQPWTIVVTEAHTLEHPCDIVALIGITPSPAVRFVLSEQTLIDAQAAADRAVAAAIAAEEAAGGAGGGTVTSVNDKVGKVVLTKGDLGLASVDNTPDSSKPVSLAQQAALDAKASLASPTFTGTVSGITKGMVGLANVDNTADAAKPVSTAQQAALDLKASLASPTFTGTVSGITKGMVGLGAVDNTADAAKPVSTATATALAGKVAATRSITPGTGLTGGGDFTADRTIGLDSATQAILATVATGRLGALSKQIDNQNLNVLLDNGFYCGGNLTNAPGGDMGVWLVRVHRSYDAGSYGEQVATKLGLGATAAGPAYRRIAEGETAGVIQWSPWVQVNDKSGAVDPAARATANAAATKAYTDAQLATKIAKGNQSIVYADIDPTIATAINNGASAYSALSGKADLVGGVIPTSQIPAIALGETFTVGSQAAMLALTAQNGDVAKRTDQNGAAYLLTGGDPTLLANWLAIGAAGGAVGSVNGQTGTVVLGKADVGLANVDNTADSAKPISTAQQAALDAKAPLASPALTGTPTAPTAAAGTSTTQVATTAFTTNAVAGKANTASPTFTGTVSGITKAMVGLSAVDNTADTAKPVSTAQQAALDLKAPLASPTFTGTVSGITKSMVGLANVDNTADTAKPVSTAQATAIALKADLASPTLTGTPSAPTAAAGTNTGQLATTAFVMANATIGDAVPTTSISPGSTSTALASTGGKSTRITLTAATTLTLAAGAAGVSYTHTLTLVQDATGGRTITWPTSVKWRGSGVKPTLSTAANAIDLVTLYWSGTEWIGMFAVDAAA